MNTWRGNIILKWGVMGRKKYLGENDGTISAKAKTNRGSVVGKIDTRVLPNYSRVK
jgi:hypothetical protein